MYITPPPISTPATDKPFSEPWKIWFRNVGNNMVEMTNTITEQNMTYSVHGNIVFVNYSGTNAKVRLPFPVKHNTIIDVYFDNTLPIVESYKYKLNAGDEYIDLTGYVGYINKIGISGWYFIDLNRPDQYVR